MLIFTSILYFCIFSKAYGIRKWYRIPNHDEEIFVNFEETVSSFVDAKRICELNNAINLVLIKKPVIDFLISHVIVDLEQERTGKCD